jgi:undecaprenyl phosphate N,N'-diacetylbacillosamine 1-phosphate transferase
MYSDIIKRIVDFMFALFLLPFLLILILAISPIIYLNDRGPVFYFAMRIGFKGKLFKMFKFRTMIVNAPDIRLEDGSTFNSNDDQRLTKVGKILRTTSIDELPQIINVLIGDMSFIGPRPDPEDWLEKYTDDEREFLKVKPGISGYNQAYFRNSADGTTKLINDVYYAKNISFLLDFKILLKTFKTVIFRDNLYVDTSQKE